MLSTYTMHCAALRVLQGKQQKERQATGSAIYMQTVVQIYAEVGAKLSSRGKHGEGQLAASHDGRRPTIPQELLWGSFTGKSHSSHPALTSLFPFSILKGKANILVPYVRMKMWVYVCAHITAPLQKPYLNCKDL